LACDRFGVYYLYHDLCILRDPINFFQTEIGVCGVSSANAKCLNVKKKESKRGIEPATTRSQRMEGCFVLEQVLMRELVLAELT
jgi:hypothetical protein